MKKIAMFIAAAAIAVSANAQKTTITGHKASDNIYVGINGGASTALKGETSFSSFTPSFGVRVSRCGRCWRTQSGHAGAPRRPRHRGALDRPGDRVRRPVQPSAVQSPHHGSICFLSRPIKIILGKDKDNSRRTCNFAPQNSVQDENHTRNKGHALAQRGPGGTQCRGRDCR